MTSSIDAWIDRHAYPAAAAAGVLGNFVLLVANPPQRGFWSFVVSAPLVGLVVGFYRVTGWQRVFGVFPAAFLCYAPVAVSFAYCGMAPASYHADEQRFIFLLLPMLAAGASPLLLAGAFVGRILRLSARPSDGGRGA